MAATLRFVLSRISYPDLWEGYINAILHVNLVAARAPHTKA